MSHQTQGKAMQEGLRRDQLPQKRSLRIYIETAAEDRYLEETPG